MYILAFSRLLPQGVTPYGIRLTNLLALQRGVLDPTANKK
jgi:hypothetical protein